MVEQSRSDHNRGGNHDDHAQEKNAMQAEQSGAVVRDAVETQRQQDTQEDLDIQTLARLEGLDHALLRFPEDVQTAARVAFKVRASFQASEDNTAEIWPVMQVKS